jgi:hypothetical protein
MVADVNQKYITSRSEKLSTDIPRIPDDLKTRIALSDGFANGKSRVAGAPGSDTASKTRRDAKVRRFVRIEAYLSHRQLHPVRGAPHAGAGGARSRAISNRMSWNICRGTATSAICENHIPAMADDLCADPDQLLAQTGQRPWLRRLRQRPHEIAKVVRQGMKLQANRIGGEGTARQRGPLDRARALFDALLAGAAVVVEGDDPLGRSPGR